jgi:hypothetical protein
MHEGFNNPPQAAGVHSVNEAGRRWGAESDDSREEKRGETGGNGEDAGQNGWRATGTECQKQCDR